MADQPEQVVRHRGILGPLASVGGLTLLSRVAGFVRDVVLAAVLGAGPLADAFFVALRLPNHFRAIFAEGAFNAAFVPAYARVRQQVGEEGARTLASGVFTLLLASQLLLLAAALLFTPALVRLLAPGFGDEPDRFQLAVELTRITFPYLLLMTLVTLFSGMLNAVDRFATAAAAPVLLNLSMVLALALAAFFPTAGHAAAWGVLAAGILEFLLVAGDASRAGIMVRFRWPRWDEELRRFFRALGPATLGSAGVQLAIFADTIIASFLTVGAISALYYADRLNQLPIGVIGIAAGTVILPEMARRLAAGEETQARHAQNRALELTLLLAAPCLAAFVVVPELIMRALFSRGAFTASDAQSAAQTLRAYALGLLPFVLIRTLVATFLARGDTATPVKASLAAVTVNIGFKIVLVAPLAQVGLALATAIGAWVNVGLVIWFARRRGLLSFDPRLLRSSTRIAFATALLAVALWLTERILVGALPPATRFRDEFSLLVLMATGGLTYGGALAVLFGAQLRELLRRPARP